MIRLLPPTRRCRLRQDIGNATHLCINSSARHTRAGSPPRAVPGPYDPKSQDLPTRSLRESCDGKCWRGFQPPHFLPRQYGALRCSAATPVLWSPGSRSDPRRPITPLSLSTARLRWRYRQRKPRLPGTGRDLRSGTTAFHDLGPVWDSSWDHLHWLQPTVDAICIAVIKSANGTDAISVQGYYSEAGELLNNCGPVIQVLSVTGGTGAYNAAQGQVTVTHIPVNPVGPTCAHSVHDFIFAVSLKHPPNGN
jgi:hypothetical protein